MTWLTSHNLPSWGNSGLILSPDLASKSNWMYTLIDHLCSVCHGITRQQLPVGHPFAVGRWKRVWGTQEVKALFPSRPGEQPLLWSSPLPSLGGFFTFSFLSPFLVETFELTVWKGRLACYFQLEAPAIRKNVRRAWKPVLFPQNFLHSKQGPQKPLVAASQPVFHWKMVLLPDV